MRYTRTEITGKDTKTPTQVYVGDDGMRFTIRAGAAPFQYLIGGDNPDMEFARKAIAAYVQAGIRQHSVVGGFAEATRVLEF